MKTVTLLVLTSVLAFGHASTSAAACEHSGPTAAATTSRAAEKRELLAQKYRATARALGNKGALRAHYDFERLRLGRRIDALEQAEMVDSADSEQSVAQARGPRC